MYNDDEAQCGCGHCAAEGCDCADCAEGEQDLIEGVDEDGNKVLLQVVRYFFYNGEEYVVLGDAQSEDDCECDENCQCHHEDDDEEPMNLYIMKVVESEQDGEEMEEFIPVEDEALLAKLIEIVEVDFDKEEVDE